jgi:hypothetical protein
MSIMQDQHCAVLKRLIDIDEATKSDAEKQREYLNSMWDDMREIKSGVAEMRKETDQQTEILKTIDTHCNHRPKKMVLIPHELLDPAQLSLSVSPCPVSSPPPIPSTQLSNPLQNSFKQLVKGYRIIKGKIHDVLWDKVHVFFLSERTGKYGDTGEPDGDPPLYRGFILHLDSQFLQEIKPYLWIGVALLKLALQSVGLPGGLAPALPFGGAVDPAILDHLSRTTEHFKLESKLKGEVRGLIGQVHRDLDRGSTLTNEVKTDYSKFSTYIWRQLYRSRSGLGGDNLDDWCPRDVGLIKVLPEIGAALWIRTDEMLSTDKEGH